MIVFNKLTPKHKFVIKQMATVRLIALKTLYNPEGRTEEEIKKILLERGMSMDDFPTKMKEEVDRNKKLIKNPRMPGDLNEREIEDFRSILMKMIPKYRKVYEFEILDIFDMLDAIECMRPTKYLSW